MATKEIGPIERLNTYRPTPSWFIHKPFGIHGIGHAARVLVWADAIGRELQMSGASLDLEAVRWAAVLHDVGRLSDGADRGHGSRSADWVMIHQHMLPVSLPDDTLQRVLACCRWHEITDQEIPVMTPELLCIKDADGLDRVRINDLNPAFLRTGPARSLVARAWELYRASDGGKDPWETVLEAASRSRRSPLSALE